ncbi:MAG: hypothetical protein M0R49_00885 [Limnochordia bacterium]|nr:hypothetical protein [Limnochordia bacterium]
MYLKRAVKRGFGPGINVRLLDVTSRDAQDSWKKERPLPLVIIDGDVVFRGSFSVQQIVKELYRRTKDR